MGTLAHCGLTSAMRQSLKLPGCHIGLAVQGPEPALVSNLRNDLGTALGRIVSPSRALWASTPRIARQDAAAGSRVGGIASSMPTLQ